MTVTIERSNVVDRPLSKVFDFFARDHVRNHPRWDPDIELWLDVEAPLGVGTIIRRRNSRLGTPVEGTMEITEFEPDKAMAVIIHDGPMEIRSRVVFEALSQNQTKFTTTIELPAAYENMDKSVLLGLLERSAQNQRQLMEAEL